MTEPFLFYLLLHLCTILELCKRSQLQVLPENHPTEPFYLHLCIMEQVIDIKTFAGDLTLVLGFHSQFHCTARYVTSGILYHPIPRPLPFSHLLNPLVLF